MKVVDTWVYVYMPLNVLLMISFTKSSLVYVYIPVLFKNYLLLPTKSYLVFKIVFKIYCCIDHSSRSYQSTVQRADMFNTAVRVVLLSRSFALIETAKPSLPFAL